MSSIISVSWKKRDFKADFSNMEKILKGCWYISFLSNDYRNIHVVTCDIGFHLINSALNRFQIYQFPISGDKMMISSHIYFKHAAELPQQIQHSHITPSWQKIMQYHYVTFTCSFQKLFQKIFINNLLVLVHSWVREVLLHW